ncbi:MAG: transporter substrate-binding domain-containing protein [Deltaproteobacteria bacterium]|nr:transporter substrate-binding domain-containing protein [Deltaproteobacteria bacterium]
MRSKRFFILFLACCLVSISPALMAGVTTKPTTDLTEQEKDFLNKTGPIRVHNESDWAPFNFNENGVPKGFSIDYIKLAAQKIGLEIRFINGPSWNEFLEMTKKGEMDIMLNIAKSPERQQFLEFTASYITMVQMLYTRKDFPPVASIKDLYGKRFAVPKGFFLHEALKAHPQIEIVEASDTSDAIRAVSIGKADVLYDLMPVVDYITKQLQINNLKVGGNLGLVEEGQPIPLHIAVRKDQKILLGILEKGMASITEEELRKLHEKWMTGESKEKHDSISTMDANLELTAEEKSFLAGKQLRLGLDDARPPFEYLDEHGDYEGISAEFIRAAAKKLGLTLLPQKKVKWTEAMEKVKTGEIDVIPKVTPTAAREKFMNFTRPYITFPSVIVTRKDHLIGGMDDLRGLKVGVIKGQVVQASLKRDRPDFSLVEAPDIETALRDLSVGKFDVFIDNLGAVSYTMDKLGLANLRIAASTPYTHDLAFGVRKDWPLLLSALDKALAGMTDQEKTELKNRWLAIQFQSGIPWHIVGPIGAALLGIIVFVLLWNRRLGLAIQERERSEKKLRFTQYAMDKAAHAIFWVRSLDAGFSYVNDTACKQLGYDRQELLELKVTDIDLDFPPDRWAGFLDALKNNEFLVTESKHRRKDGAILDVELTCYLNEYEGNEIIIAFVKDITERKKVEERFQSMAANVPGAIFQAKITTEGELRFLYVSPGCEEHFGLSPAALIESRQKMEIHQEDRGRFEQTKRPRILNTSNLLDSLPRSPGTGNGFVWWPSLPATILET